MTRRKLNYKPLTLWNIPGDRRFFDPGRGGHYTYMFIEDVRNQIMPFYERSFTRNKIYEANINNPALETKVKVLFHTSYGHDPHHQSLREVVFDFIRDASIFILAGGGKGYFEIVEATIEENETSKPVYILKPIHGKVIKLGRTYFQIIPKEIEEAKERFIPVPQSKVWVLGTPKELGRARDIISMSNSLTELGRSSFIDLEVIKNQADFYGFEFTKFHTLIEENVLKTTRLWGWDKRMALNNQHALEYYLYYRMLRFRYALAIFRNDLLSKMNVLLNKLGYDATLSFSGIPTPEEILAAINKLEQRQLSFKEADELIFF